VLAEHRGRNAQLADALRKAGVDPAASRSIECHFWAVGREEAALLGRALYERGFLVLALAPAVHLPNRIIWNVEAAIQQSPDATMSDGFIREIAGIAFAHSAVFDGWGTPV
jgi:regulator of RNase E activity RraB